MIDLAILIISFVAMIASLVLMYKNIKDPGYCPDIFRVPACYIATYGFYLVFLSYFFQVLFWNMLIFFIGAIGGLLVAAWFSYKRISGKDVCPVWFGIPMCFASFVTFSALIVLKIILF